MVDVMIGTVTNLSLQVLRDILVAEAKFLLSVKDDVKKVKRISKSIGALLEKAERERSDSPTLEDYINQLRDLGFEAGIVLETYAVEVESKREAGLIMRCICFVCECCSTHEVGKQARDIVARLADITGKLGSELGQGSREQDLSRLTYAHTFDPHTVGMKQKIEDLLPMVKEGEKWERVITICGIGGLGKTTLARKIYNHGDVASYARAWVCATQQFEAKAVLGAILKQLDENAKVDGMGVPELVGGIHGILEQREKCLIVIDDIWENDDWNVIKSAFPMNRNVLLTTRNERVANQECLRPYKLKVLTEDEGWGLLLKIALPRDFAQVGRGLRSLKDIGRKIVVKCGGLPLSIWVIGGILGQKEEHSIEEWETVSGKIDSYLVRGEGVEQDKRVKQVLDLSYDALPYYLKPCFLYFACFDEDEEIETERLYLMWIAEGFISEKHKGRKERLRDVAERYLIELGKRNLVQVHKTEISSHQEYDVRLHDLMHDLCSSKAEAENFVKRIEISEHHTDIPSIGNSISRLAISSQGYISRTLRIRGLEKVQDLRSLMLLREDRFSHGGRIHIKDSTINLEKSKRVMMVLALDNCEFEGAKLPSKVAKLIHLRYLSLYNSTLRQLPEYVCSMPYLHTLDLREVQDSGFALRLPRSIRYMKRLRYLFLSTNVQVIGGDNDEKLRLDGMVELETLEGPHSRSVCVADILKLSSLRKLKVVVNDVDSLRAVVHHMRSNRNRWSRTHLSIANDDSDDHSSWEIGGDVFKDVLMFPSLVVLSVRSCSISGGLPLYKRGMCRNLVNLQLFLCKVGEDVSVIQELGNYPMLQFLYLDRVEFARTETVVFRANSFPQLRSLNLFDLPDLEKWEVAVGAMPKLTELEIRRCQNLEKVPEGLRNITTIRELKISGMPEAFNNRVRGQDNGSISHIPSVTLD